MLLSRRRGRVVAHVGRGVQDGHPVALNLVGPSLRDVLRGELLVPLGALLELLLEAVSVDEVGLVHVFDDVPAPREIEDGEVLPLILRRRLGPHDFLDNLD